MAACFNPEVTVANMYGWVCDRAPDVERVTGKACPASLSARPKVAEYQQRLSDFRTAITGGDETFLTRLQRTGFKIRTADLCSSAVRLSERTGPEALSEAGTEIFLRSLPETHACDSGSWMLRQTSVSIPVVLLDRALFPHAAGEKGEGDRLGCGVDLAVTYWPRQQELIRRVVQRVGVVADFSKAVADYGAFFEKLKVLSPQAYESACRQALLTEQPSPEFIFSSVSCSGMGVLQRRWRLQKAMGLSANEAADQVCRGAGPLDLTIFQEILARWARLGRAESGNGPSGDLYK